MNAGARDDRVLRWLAELPSVAGDERRTKRVRAKCHRELRRRAQHDTLASYVLHAGVALLGTAYLAQLARLAVVIVR